MPSGDEFELQVRDALPHLYEYPYLETHPLALRFWPVLPRHGPRRAYRLSRLLLDSIEELSPPGASPSDISHGQAYAVLVRRYVDERPITDIMRELGYSRSHYFREQKRAISLLASRLWQKLLEQNPQEPDTGLLDAEADRLLVQRDPLNPTEVITSVMEVVGRLASQHGVALAWDVSPDLPAMYGSRTLLRQVLLKALSHLISRPRDSANPGGSVL